MVVYKRVFDHRKRTSYHQRTTLKRSEAINGYNQ
jgi:hypothetical protein